MEEYLKDYGNCHEDILEEAKEEKFNHEELMNRIWEDLQDNTTIILIGDDLDDGFIIQSY